MGATNRFVPLNLIMDDPFESQEMNMSINIANFYIKLGKGE